MLEESYSVTKNDNYIYKLTLLYYYYIKSIINWRLVCCADPPYMKIGEQLMIMKNLKRKHRVFALIVCVLLFSLLGYLGARVVYFESNRDDLTALSSKYVDAMCISVPSDIRNYSDSEFDSFRETFMKEKSNLHDQIFAENMKNDTFLPTLESILIDIGNRTDLLVSSTYQNMVIEKIETDFGSAQITFTVDWVEDSYVKTDSSDYSLTRNNGSTKYTINCAKENGTWKINEIRFDPFN